MKILGFVLIVFLLYQVAYGQDTLILSEYRISLHQGMNRETGNRVLKITDVLPNTEWERAGAQVGDFIIAINGRTSKNVNEFDTMLKQAANRAKAYGTSFCVTIDRNDQIFDICLWKVATSSTSSKRRT